MHDQRAQILTMRQANLRDISLKQHNNIKGFFAVLSFYNLGEISVKKVHKLGKKAGKPLFVHLPQERGRGGGEEGVGTKVINSGRQVKRKSKCHKIPKINASLKGTSCLAF